jgi:hypothetical protein
MVILKKIILKENFNSKGSCGDPLQKIGLNSRGQVWVETVIYTLIGLAVIGILLAVSKPKIEQMKDRIIIEQSIKSLNEISSRIYDVQIASGNKRVLDLKVSKGTFYINATNNRVGWIMESNYKYSEVGSEVNLGNMKVKTIEGGPYVVEMWMTYTVNISNAGRDDYQSYEQSPTLYKLTIENNGKINSNTNVDLNVI